jgi:RloB-like protein
VRVRVDEFHGEPAQLVERAEGAKKGQLREARQGGGRPYDEIWCVFDDDRRPNLTEAIRRAAQGGINIAVSSPCIELWFILHYQDQTAHIEPKQAQALSKQLLKCSKTVTEQAFEALANRYDDAVKRAQYLDRKHEGDGSPPHTNPSSEVWKLVERIRTAEQP